MRIQSVLIDGFKNISDVRIRFDKLTALVSVNNFGKSNVLSAIGFGLGYIKASVEHKSNMMANSEFIPLNKATYTRNYRFEIEVLSELDNSEFRIIYGYEFVWKSAENKEPAIVSEYLKFRPEDSQKKYTQLISRSGNNALYKSSESGRCSSRINIESTELVLNKLRAIDEIYYAQIIRKLNNIRYYMEDNLDVRNFYNPDPLIRKGISDITIDADNLPRVIFQLKEKDPGKFDLLKSTFIGLFPDIEDIIVQRYDLKASDEDKLPEESPYIIANAIYILYVKNSNLKHPMNFSTLSDGSKRVFMILTRIILAKESDVSLIAIEEPENSVHPGLFQSYLQIISQLLDDCKIVMTSHSPYIISYLEPAWIYVGISRKPGIAEFFTFRKSGQNLLHQEASSFGMSTGDYLFSLLSDDCSNWDDYLECDIDG